MTDTIKAVAGAMKPYLPAEVDGNIFSAAEAAINAMQIREMTVEEVAEIIYECAERDASWFETAAKALAKFGTIRIVGSVK